MPSLEYFVTIELLMAFGGVILAIIAMHQVVSRNTPKNKKPYSHFKSDLEKKLDEQNKK